MRKISIWITAEEWEQIKAAADLQDTSASDYVRVSAGGAANDDLEAEERRQRERRRQNVPVNVDRRAGERRVLSGGNERPHGD